MRLPAVMLWIVALGGCRDWPVCGNEDELTEANGEFGTVENGDYLVCSKTLGAGDCPDYHDIDVWALYEDAVGPTRDGDGDFYYELRADCGPETTRTDACCYVVEIQTELILYLLR